MAKISVQKSRNIQISTFTSHHDFHHTASKRSQISPLLILLRRIKTEKRQHASDQIIQKDIYEEPNQGLHADLPKKCKIILFPLLLHLFALPIAISSFSSPFFLFLAIEFQESWEENGEGAWGTGPRNRLAES